MVGANIGRLKQTTPRPGSFTGTGTKLNVHGKNSEGFALDELIEKCFA